MEENKPIPPFRRFVIQNFPFIEEDFDALTNYALLCKIVEYLNQVINQTNANTDQVEALTTAFNTLKDYVDHYFDNLNVQAEINAKLDDMVRDGTMSSLLQPLVSESADQILAEVRTTLNEFGEEIDSNTNEITVLSSRMDEFSTLTDGSTTGDAELADIRVAFDGKTYANAGTAVRKQCEFLDNAINLTNRYKRYKIISQTAITNHPDVLLPNHRYAITTLPTTVVRSTAIIYSTPTYDASEPTNVRLWNDTLSTGMNIIEPSNTYRSLRLWQRVDATTPTLDVIIYDITYEKDVFFESTVTDVPLYFVNGGMDDVGNVNDSAQNKVALQRLPYRGTCIVTMPDDLYVRVVRKVPGHTNPTEILTYNHPLSFKAEMDTYMCFGYKDGTALRVDDSILENISVQFVNNYDPEYDVILASPTTPAEIKYKADIVVTNDNSTAYLASMFGADSDMKVLLLDGDYNIDYFHTIDTNVYCALPIEKSGCLKHTYITNRHTIEIEGNYHVTPQNHPAVNLIVTQNCYEAVDTTGDYYIIGTPYNSANQVNRNHKAVSFKNFNVIGYYYDKAMTYIDLSECTNVELESVNIRGWHEYIDTYQAFYETPNLECVGIRVGRGNQYGIQNKCSHLSVWYCGKGFVCNGEHFILEDIKTHHDYIGFYFGDRNTVGAVAHPNVMIGCSIEGCYRFMVLTKQGVTTEQAYTTPIDGKTIHRSTLIIIGQSTETTWFVPTSEIVGDVTQRRTLPILEIIKGAYNGRMDIDLWFDAFEVGSGTGFIVNRYDATTGKTYIVKGSNVIE